MVRKKFLKSVFYLAVFLVFLVGSARAITLPNLSDSSTSNIIIEGNFSHLNLYTGNTIDFNSSLTSLGTSFSFIANLSQNYTFSSGNISSVTVKYSNLTWMNFNTTNYVNIPLTANNNFSSGSQWTIVTKVKTTDTAANTFGLFGAKENETGNMGGIALIRNGASSYIYIYNNTGGSSFSNLSLSANLWNYYSFVYNGSKTFAYVNRTLADSDNAVELGDTDLSLRLGAVSGIANSWNGSIDYLTIYNQTLSSEQLNISYWNDGQVTKGINTTSLSVWESMQVLPNDDVFYIDSVGLVKVSTNGGNSFTTAYDFNTNHGIADRAIGMFIDSKNNTFVGFDGNTNNSLWKSPANSDGSYNLSNWRVSLTFATPSGMFWNQGMTETSSGSLFVGEYADGAKDENSSFVYRSRDEGVSWSLVYNDSEFYAQANVGEHVHFCQADPYTDYIYCSFGDSQAKKKIIRSTDDGDNWTTLKSGFEDGFSWQPTSITFTEEYRLLGEDFAVSGAYSRIIRTSDDENFETVWNGDGAYTGAIFWLEKDNQGVIYSGIVNGNNQSDKVIVASDNNGTSWYVVKKVGDENKTQLGTSSGWGFASNADSNGNIYVRGFTSETYSTNNLKIKTTSKPSSVGSWRLNENSGTIAYDTSSYGNNGTLTGSPTWTDGGTNITLTGGVDYTLFSSDGKIRLNSPDYDKCELDVSYDYYNLDSVYNYLVSYYSFDGDILSTKLTKHYDFKSGYDGTGINNSLTQSVGCLYGNCLNLTGYNDYSSSSLSTGSGNFTYSLWAKLGDESITNYLLGGTSTAYLAVVSDGRLLARVFNTTNGAPTCYSSDTGSKINDANWHHIVMVISNNPSMNISYYIDGSIVDVGACSISGVYNSQNLGKYIGYTGAGLDFIGLIDEVMIFNTSLTSGNILGIYSNQSKRFVSSGTQSFSNRSLLSISSGSNRINVTTIHNSSFGSILNLSIGSYYSAAWHSSASQQTTGNNLFNISYFTTNLTLNYTFSSDSSGFYSPLLFGGIDFSTLNNPGSLLVNLVSPPNNTFSNNLTNIFSCNASTHDEITNLTLYLWNSTNSLNYTNTTLLSGTENSTNWTYALPYDGSWNWNCLVYSGLNNSNWSSQGNYTLTIDTVAPEIALILPAESASSASTSWTFSFNVTDSISTNCSLLLDGSVANFNSSVNISGGNNSFVNSVAAGNHVWSVNCTDSAGNSANSSTRTFTIDAEASATTDSSSGTLPNYKISTANLENGYEQSLREGFKISFSGGDGRIENHTLTVKEVSGGDVTIIVSSEPITFVLKVNETKKLDLDKNGIYDLEVSLKEIKGYFAKVFLKSLNEKIIGGENVETDEETPKNATEDSTEREDKKEINLFVIFVSAVVLIILVICLILVLRHRKKKRRLHGYR